MTTTTALAAPAGPQRNRLRPQGLPGALLILHRSALWFWLLLVALAGGILLWMYGWGTDAAYAEFVERGCVDGSAADSCDFNGPAYSLYDTAETISSGLINVVPLLTALWAGAVLIGRELENGTARLAWTQSVSPARWLAAKLAVPAALLTAGTVLLTLLHRLAWDAHTELFDGRGPQQWQETNTYLANGTLAPAYALLGLAVGVLAGVLTRRSLAALGTAFFAAMIPMFVLFDLRPHLWPALTAISTEGYPDHVGMLIEEGGLTAAGQRIDAADCTAQCMSFYRDYHPSSHFWPLQLMETGIVLALATAATAAAFWLLRRRTA